MSWKRIYLFLIGISLFWGIESKAQSPQDIEKIAASQRCSSPLLFEVNAEKAGHLKLSDFNSAEECDVRRGLPHFFEKINSGEDITIAFIGGSLTQANFCYRLQISNFIQQQYPQVGFKWINAGISGTGTDLGAFRIEEQVLSQNPDLVFIDFAVNGAYADGMEGIVRQIIQHNFRTDICFIYAILGSHTASYQQGKVPSHIRNLEQLADHYGIPSVHMGMESAYLEAEGKLLWKGSETEAGTKILFSHDGIHPLKKGGDLYAMAMARSILKMSKQDKDEAEMALPNALHTELWDEAHMYSPREIASFDQHWRDVSSNDSHLNMFSGWFDTLTTAYQAQATCSFSFEGDLFGLFDIGGPEAGQLEIWIDGKKVKLEPNEESGFQFFRTNEESRDSLLNRFNEYCNNRYRGQYNVIAVPYGVHHVKYVISPLRADKAAILGEKQQQDILSNPEKYDHNRIYLGRILLRGKPLGVGYDKKTKNR